MRTMMLDSMINLGAHSAPFYEDCFVNPLNRFAVSYLHRRFFMPLPLPVIECSKLLPRFRLLVRPLVWAVTTFYPYRPDAGDLKLRSR
ncbi:MAG: hypothetical protein WBN36_02945 [Gammaproteobacteria bacterium]